MSTSMRSLIALTATALAVAGCGGGGNGDSQPQDAPPQVSVIANVTINQDTPGAAIPFSVADDRTAAANLTVTASSSDTGLIAADGITLGGGGGGGNRTMMVTPTEASVGSATIAVTVTDAAGLSTTRTFGVTVNAVNVAFTPWAFDAFAESETADSRSMLGFTLVNDSDDRPDAFDPLF